MSTHSSLDQLNQAIKDCNPFESNFVVKSHHIWNEEFPDVPSLHTHASDTVIEVVQKINGNQIQSKTVGLAILAPKGVGKTHVLSRLRRHLKNDGNGFFIYMGEYSNLSAIKRQFLQCLASSLKKTGSQGVTQWQELATALISRAMGKKYVAQQLTEQFPKALAKKPEVVNQLTSKVLPSCPDLDNPYILKAIIWTLSKAHAPFAINWLSGKELSEAQAKAMDLPDSSKDDKDAEAFNITRQILDLISYYTTPIICFDELDAVESVDDSMDPMLGGFTRAQVVASLVKDLYNNLKRGVLVTAMYAQTWKEEFSSISNAAGIKDRIAQKEISLNPLKADDAVLLVACWLEDFYSKQGLTPPQPVYPFEEKQIRELGDGATVRDILQWCAKNFSKNSDPTKRLEKIYQGIENSLEDFSEDNERIANALAFGLQRLQGQTIERVTIESLDREVNPRWKHRGFINFRIIGKEDGKDVKIGVCVLQNSHGKTVGAAVKYLTWYKDFDLTRGCLVRSKDIYSHWQVANTSLNQLLHEQGGEWVSLKDEEIKPLLALYQMHKELDREVFSEEEFDHFVREKHLLSENGLIKEILSDPSGQAPEDLINEDMTFDDLLLEANLDAGSSSDSEELDFLEAAVV